MYSCLFVSEKENKVEPPKKTWENHIKQIAQNNLIMRKKASTKDVCSCIKLQTWTLKEKPRKIP